MTTPAIPDALEVFVGSRRQLENAQNRLAEARRAEDPRAFRSSYEAFVSHARAVTFAMQKEGKAVPGFERWYDQLRDKMRADPLVAWFHEARNRVEKRGEDILAYRIEFGAEQQIPLSSAPPGATDYYVNYDGIFWAIAGGTPQERLVPIEGVSYSATVQLADPPRTHRGAELAEPHNPVAAAELHLAYLGEFCRKRSRGSEPGPDEGAVPG